MFSPLVIPFCDIFISLEIFYAQLIKMKICPEFRLCAWIRYLHSTCNSGKKRFKNLGWPWQSSELISFFHQVPWGRKSHRARNSEVWRLLALPSLAPAPLTHHLPRTSFLGFCFVNSGSRPTVSLICVALSCRVFLRHTTGETNASAPTRLP